MQRGDSIYTGQRILKMVLPCRSVGVTEEDVTDDSRVIPDPEAEFFPVSQMFISAVKAG